MRLIKLTKTTGQNICINPDYIIIATKLINGNGTGVILSGGLNCNTVIVVETPEDIIKKIEDSLL